MKSTTFVVLLAVTSIVTISSSFAAFPNYDINSQKAIVIDDQQGNNTTTSSGWIQAASNDGVVDWGKAEIDGIALKSLTADELKDLLDAEDNIIIAELDIATAKKAVSFRKNDTLTETNSVRPKHRQRRFLGLLRGAATAAKKAWQGLRRMPKPGVVYVDNRHKRAASKPQLVNPIMFKIIAKKVKQAFQQQRSNSGQGKRRPKRWVGGLARLFSAGRNLFNGAVRAPKTTVSGKRVTQEYNKPGNFEDAVRSFNQFRPDDVTSFSKNGISGQTGTVGPHRFTVRDGSKQGSPTVEIRSPRPNGEHVRKIRFNER
ncbi:unnamed protein product [Candidula unifasciata]|uniref:Uncharacterized protein n=1 Tax=Candidula unifasciata TaxID=100452 RepID=A0A8S3ZR98_9EUPU|nr:unnamed protein product [Candidula unifasciata]